MTFWGLLFIAIGVSALLDINIWPLVLIVIGIAMVLPVLSGGRRQRSRYAMWWRWWDPSAWERSRERRGPDKTTNLRVRHARSPLPRASGIS